MEMASQGKEKMQHQHLKKRGKEKRSGEVITTRVEHRILTTMNGMYQEQTHLKTERKKLYWPKLTLKPWKSGLGIQVIIPDTLLILLILLHDSKVKQKEDSLECKMRREDDRRRCLLFREKEQQRQEQKRKNRGEEKVCCWWNIQDRVNCCLTPDDRQ